MSGNGDTVQHIGELTDDLIGRREHVIVALFFALRIFLRSSHHIVHRATR